ncbi:phage regulatory CII family protein [Paraburkholderia sp. NPDC080076]|uniref:phage regulatory CII family protein n=1 Tax=Paraburkholderia sp. NPDC080076 TaxID=3390605 RepID=UPI003CFF31B2
MEMFELLVEWMEEKRQPQCFEAIHALNARFGLRATEATDQDAADNVDAVALGALDFARQSGVVAGEVRTALADGVITPQEVDAIAVAARANQRLLDRLLRTVQAVSRLGRRQA